jgi:hypothetical protein
MSDFGRCECCGGDVTFPGWDRLCDDCVSGECPEQICDPPQKVWGPERMRHDPERRA